MGADSLIVGCGGIGVRVAARAVAAGLRVTGLVRSAVSARRVRAVGAQALAIDLDSDSLTLPVCRQLFYFAPPPATGTEDPRVARVLAALPEPPEQLVYISTSGVYGDCGGDWVDEDRPVAPATARARRRVDAERQVMAFQPRALILRAPGIYGPGRLPIARLRDGEPVLADGEGGWTNRVHVDDLAAIAWWAASDQGTASRYRIFNACDGYPTSQALFYDVLAGMLNLPPPPRIDWAGAQHRFSDIKLSFLRESRRLANARLRDAMGRSLVYADFREGLAASLRAEAHGNAY